MIDDDDFFDQILKDIDSWAVRENLNERSLNKAKNSTVQDTSPFYISEPAANSLKKLAKYSITGQTAELRKQMLADQFVLKNIALMGQWTVIYGAPNSGKTLITNWLLRESIMSDDVDGEAVFYVNADDTYRGLIQKTELAENWGMHILAPGHNGLAVGQVLELMSRLGDDGFASGTVIILDTLKKFTDLMDKRSASEFGVVVRGFVAKGGTLIALAHTNKNVDVDGKRIYSGTSDIVDDCDCAFVIDKVSIDERDGEATHTIEFTNIKARGDVSSKAGFSYKKLIGQSYQDLLTTVRPLDRTHLEEVKEQAHAQSALDSDRGIIEAVCELIDSGTVTKDKIIKCTHDLTGESISRVRSVLEQRAGIEYARGHRWTMSKGANNRYLYAVLRTP